jgi:hypothetical protein
VSIRAQQARPQLTGHRPIDGARSGFALDEFKQAPWYAHPVHSFDDEPSLERMR